MDNGFQAILANYGILRSNPDNTRTALRFIIGRVWNTVGDLVKFLCEPQNASMVPAPKVIEQIWGERYCFAIPSTGFKDPQSRVNNTRFNEAMNRLGVTVHKGRETGIPFYTGNGGISIVAERLFPSISGILLFAKLYNGGDPKPVSVEDIGDHLWGEEYLPSDRDSGVRNTVFYLRRAMEESRSGVTIENKRRRDYQMCLPPKLFSLQGGIQTQPVG